MTFAEFRRARLISQNECAELLGLTRDYIRGRDPKPLSRYWATGIDDMLARGPHEFIKPRYFYPELPMLPMLATVRRRLPVGACYLSLEYFQPDTLEIARSRKDLIAVARSRPAERLFILRRIIGRSSRVPQVQVISVKIPEWPAPTFDT